MEAHKKLEGRHSELTGKIVSCHCEEGVLSGASVRRSQSKDPDAAIFSIEKKM